MSIILLIQRINRLVEEEETNIIENTNKEKTSFYEIYKILSQEKYEMGRSVKEFVTSFKKEKYNS